MNRTSDLFLRIAAVVAFTVGSSAVFNIGTASQGVALPGPGQATTSGVKGPPGDASSNTPNPKVFVSDENLEAYAAACEKERLAANKVYQLKGAVLEDQNQIRALGFDRDSQKFEEMEKTAKERRSQFYLGIVRTMLGQIAETTRGLDGEMTRTQAIAYKNLFHGRAPAAEQVIDKAIRDAGTAEKIHVGPSGMHELVESVDHTWDAANLATSPANIGDVVHNGITVAQVMGLPAPFATLLDGATDLGQLAWDTHEANKLLELTEDQLTQLGRLSNQVRADGAALASARSALASAQSMFSGGSCDSTRLVKKEPLKADTKVASSIAPASSVKSGGGHTGLILLGVLGAGGAAAGVAAASMAQTQSQQTSSCSPPSVSPGGVCNSVYESLNGTADCNAALAAGDQYCKCEGFTSINPNATGVGLNPPSAVCQ